MRIPFQVIRDHYFYLKPLASKSDDSTTSMLMWVWPDGVMSHGWAAGHDPGLVSMLAASLSGSPQGLGSGGQMVDGRAS